MGQWGKAQLLYMYVQPWAKFVLYQYSKSCSATSTSQGQLSGSNTYCWCVGAEESNENVTMKIAQQSGWLHLDCVGQTGGNWLCSIDSH